jgi:hypothetical protein
MSKRVCYRSAVTGRWVSKAFADAAPNETVAEQVGIVKAAVVAVKVKLAGG